MEKIKVDIDVNIIEKQSYQSRESYKVLRTNILFCGSDIKTVLFTSATQKEGKSTVTFNLAMSLASAGKKVILVDADLRRSVLIERYKINEPINGLSSYLAGQCDLENVIVGTNIKDMDVILCGKYPKNPAELLGHENFALMMEKLRQQYDYVIVDAPPLGEVIDAAIIATHCDGSVIVTESGKISYKLLKEIKRQLVRSKSRLLGVIINKMPVPKRHGVGKYYSSYEENIR